MTLYQWFIFHFCRVAAYGVQDFLEKGGPPGTAGSAMEKLLQTWQAEGKLDGSNRKTHFYDIRARRGTHPGECREDAMHKLDLMAQDTVLPPDAEILPLDHAAEVHLRLAAGGLNHRLVLQQ